MTRPSRAADPTLAHGRTGPPAPSAPPAPTLPRLLLLTDRSQLRLGRSLVRTVAECVEAGLTHVVLRELDLPHPHRAALAAELSATGASVIAAHTPLPGAVGLHLPAAARRGNTMSAEVAAPRDMLLPASTACYPLRGRSCHTPAEVAAAADEGFAYVTLGPYTDTASKPGYGPPLPLSAYAGHPIPVYALGGIDAATAAAAVETGAHRVAVMGAVMRSADPAGEIRRLLEVLR